MRLSINKLAIVFLSSRILHYPFAMRQKIIEGTNINSMILEYHFNISYWHTFTKNSLNNFTIWSCNHPLTIDFWYLSNSILKNISSIFIVTIQFFLKELKSWFNLFLIFWSRPIFWFWFYFWSIFIAMMVYCWIIWRDIHRIFF